jgi:hypothetical protein
MDGGGVDECVDGGELLEPGKFDMYGDGVRNGFVMRCTLKSRPSGSGNGAGGGIPAIM